MAKKPKPKYEEVKHEALEEAQQWAKNVSVLPTPIEQLAQRLNVRRVEFQPLLSTGGIEREENGFIICINTEADGVTQLPGTALEVSASEWNQLKPPLRFTIAHELSHLLLFKAAGFTKEVFQEKTGDLETTCNNMAGILLLPKERLLREASNNFLNAEHLANLLRLFRVSPEAFLIRLASSELDGAFVGIEGILALACDRDGKFELPLFQVWGQYPRNRWRNVAQGASLEELHLQPEMINDICETERVEREFEMAWSPHEFIRCSISTRRLYRNPTTILVAIRIHGAPERRSKA